MKLKKLEQVIKRSKILYISQGSDCQWIGDGIAMYPLQNLPKLTVNELCILLDISAEEQSQYAIKEMDMPKCLNFADIDNEETPLQDAFFSFTAFKRNLKPLFGSHGAFFLDTYYLKPFDDIKNKIALTERISADGLPYIAVKDGMFLLGVILPYSVDDDFIRNLGIFADNAKDYYCYLERRKEKLKNE